ncbi:MAG: carbohydrate ABC transporter permease [Chloroflexi bacterium]|nr:MAG: carbohydrate ABC transporter permease [Chloroflexota bacterium]
MPHTHWLERLAPHFVLIAYCIVALFPIVLIVMNSFKSRDGIFSAPFQPPTAETFSLIGYETVLGRANFPNYFLNSLIVTGVSLLLILFFGSMAAFALSQYHFRGDVIVGLFLALGIMVPIRLGTIGILRMIVSLNLANTLVALILVYIAQGLPLTVFILDLWFPLILAPSDQTATITLGTQQFLGQFVSDWNAVLAALTLAMVPILLMYILFSRQMVKSVTAGAVK